MDGSFIVMVTVITKLIDNGVMIYMPVYLAGFYFGPLAIQKMSSLPADLKPWAYAIIGLAIDLGGCRIMLAEGILPPFDDRCTDSLVSVCLNIPVTLGLVLFFMNLPKFVNLQM